MDPQNKIEVQEQTFYLHNSNFSKDLATAIYASSSCSFFDLNEHHAEQVSWP